MTQESMPFAVDFKERIPDRLYRHVTFPGSEGVYRIRTVNTGRTTESTVVQRYADTALPLATVEGEIFRIKAVLDTPDSGISESYWLTLNQQQEDPVERLNQYRIRGIALEAWRSDWVYSELRTDENELVVYDMLYDLLDLILSVRDQDISAFLTLMASDAFKFFADKERASIVFTKEVAESLAHDLTEQAETAFKLHPTHQESVQTVLQELFQKIGKNLKSEFSESFMAGSKEFSEILKMYKVYDRTDASYKDIASLVFQAFLEESIEKVVHKTALEVLVENEGNKQLYLEGEFELDVRAELLRAAYDLMPTDRFLMSLNSTIQLIIGPVAVEDFPYEQVENIRQQARFFRNEITETTAVAALEDVVLFLRILVDDLYLPYLLIDQRLLQLYIDLKDTTEMDFNKSEGLVEYDLDTPEGFIRHMLVRDAARELIVSDQMRYGIYGDLIDRMMSGWDERRSIVLDYHFAELFDVLADMGEHAEGKLRHLFQKIQESAMVDLNDVTNVHVEPDLRHMEQLRVHLMDEGRFTEKQLTRLTDLFSFEIRDEAFADPGLFAYVSENLSADLRDAANTANTIRGLKQEPEKFAVIPGDLMSPTYKLHPHETYLRIFGERRYVQLDSELQDHYLMTGREVVRFVLGDVSKDGWPVGNFILGANTLK